MGISGLDYFRDKINRYLERCEKSPEMTEMLNKCRLEAFLKGEKINEDIEVEDIIDEQESK